MAPRYVPFEPTGPTIKVASDSTAPTGVTTSADGGGSLMQYRIHNSGTVMASYAFGIDGATAKANAVVPTGDGVNAKRSIPIGAGAIEVITAPRGTYWSAISASAVSVYITPGAGV